MGRTRRCGGKVIDGEAFMYIPDICRGKIIKDREKRELRRAGDWAIFVGREKI